MQGFRRKAQGLQPLGFEECRVPRRAGYSSRSSGSVATKEATITR